MAIKGGILDAVADAYDFERPIDVESHERPLPAARRCLPRAPGDLAQLPPCDPDDPPTGCVEGAVPRPIALERRGGPVDGAPVQLCDQAGIAPDAVGLHEPSSQGDRSIQLGPREAALGEEPQEALLQLAPGERGPEGTGGEDRADRSGTASPWVSGK